MARIKTYVVDTLISGRDMVIGSDADDLLKTKNYRVDSLRDYMLSGLDPEIGGSLKITTIVDTSVEFLTPEDYFNGSVDTIEVLSYEIVFLILNGRTYIFRKNGDIYGVGEAQTVESDFTEIDITSVINANLQDLQSVLTEGNESVLDAKINDLYLMDEGSGFGNIRLFGDNDSLNINDLKDEELFRFFLDNIRIFSASGGTHFTIAKPSISVSRTATLQDASGTIAYLSDIPTVDVLGIEEGDNISITETDGVYTISATSAPVGTIVTEDSSGVLTITTQQVATLDYVLSFQKEGNKCFVSGIVTNNAESTVGAQIICSFSDSTYDARTSLVTNIYGVKEDASFTNVKMSFDENTFILLGDIEAGENVTVNCFYYIN
jgi:hypothetical protein